MQYLKEIQILFLSSFEKLVFDKFFLPALPFRPVDPAQKKKADCYLHTLEPLLN